MTLPASPASTGPVVEVRFAIVGKVWITTTHELTSRVLKDSETFTLRTQRASTCPCH